MLLLIDYDNVARLERQRGVVHVITRLLNAIPPARLIGQTSVRTRLYGGWFDGPNLSRGAQALAPDLASQFPRVVVVSDAADTVSLKVRAELAISLECDPTIPITHTFRRRSVPENLTCETPPFHSCSIPGTCPIASLHGLFDGGVCPQSGCPVSRDRILSRDEQKLVDSMLSIDLAFFSLVTTELVALASADDDMWPSIRFALLRGVDFIHVFPRTSGSGVPPQYRALTTGRYSHFSI